MRGANLTGRRLQQSHEERRPGSENDQAKRRQHETQKRRDPPTVTDDMLRQDHHELLPDMDKFAARSRAQEQEEAFYRNIVSEISSKDLCRLIHELQHQLQQFSVDFEYFTRENTRISHEHNQRSKYKSSMRDSLVRLTEANLILTRENKALRAGDGLERDGLEELEEEESMPTPSRIRRKTARTNLRSHTVDRGTAHLERQQNRLGKNQESPKNELASKIPDLRNDFADLQSKLKAAREHIVNIGGNLGALLPREVVKTDFQSLVGATQTWIATCVHPAISNSEQCFQAFECARKIQGQDAGLNLSRIRNQDFREASKFPGVDESAFLVMIFDLLVDMVLSAKVLYGDQQVQKEIDVIKQLELSMRLNSDSAKSLYNSRRWMSEAMSAILSRKETQVLRTGFSHVLADLIIRGIGLPAILGHSNQTALEAAERSLRQEVVLPAIELGDKILCAIDKYSLEVPSYWSEPCMFQTEFFRDLASLDCKNLGGGPPRFKLEKMRATFSDDEIRSQLTAICPAIPALVLTEAGDRKWGPDTTMVKQQVWVSWQPKKKPTPQSDEREYFWFLYHRDSMNASAGKE